MQHCILLPAEGQQFSFNAFPAVFPGSLARQLCPAALPGSLLEKLKT
jgi:hypothetical protein